MYSFSSRRQRSQCATCQLTRTRSGPLAAPAATSARRSRTCAQAECSVIADLEKASQLRQTVADARLCGTQRYGLSFTDLPRRQPEVHREDNCFRLLATERAQRRANPVAVGDLMVDRRAVDEVIQQLGRVGGQVAAHPQHVD